MTSSPLTLRSLSITAFRGVRTSLDVTLPGRLTLLLAPNGTGKTTLCHALEWLLTGQVSGIAEQDLKCLISEPSAEPRVSAEIAVGDATRWIERTCGQWRMGEDNNRLRKVMPGALLEFLAPEAATAETGRVANDMRQSWLRGTRLLAGHDLALLLDDEKESVDSRRRVFADLLGVEHLEASVRQIKRYVDEMGPEFRSVEKSVAALAAEDELAATLKQPPPAAEGALARAAEILDADVPSPDSKQALNALTTELARRRSLLDQRATLIGRVKAAFPRMAGLEAEQASLQKRIDASTATSRWCFGWLARLEKIRAWELQDALRAAQAIHEVENRLDRLRAVRSDPALAPVLDTGKPLAVLRREIDAQSHRFAVQRLVDLEGLIGVADKMRAALARKAELEAADGFSPQAAAPDEVERAALRLAELREQQEETTSRLSALSGPLGELRVVGLAALEALGDAAVNCPLCGHDWARASSLIFAIKRTLASTAPAVRAVEAELTHITALVREQDSQLARLNRRVELYTAWQEVVRIIEQYSDRAQAFGLPPSPEQWEEEARQAQTLRDVGQALGQLAAIFAELSLKGVEGLPVLQAVEVVHDHLETELCTLQGRQALAERAIQRADTLRPLLSRRTRQDNLDDANRSLVAVGNELARLDQDWRGVSDRELSEASLAEIDHHLLTQQDRLADAQAYLDAARASLEYVEASRQARLRSDLLREQRRQANLLRGKIDLARTLSEHLSRHRDNFVRQQLTALMPTVRSLFARVHANHVFDTILHGDDSDPLKWFAEIDGNRLPTGHFSQGQRQDLALAIFLARACSLGGTFFLDEPLVHLDDLNRVAVLDILRAIALSQPQVHLVLTTASRPLARHLKEKFGRLDRELLHVLELQGDPRSGRIAIEPMA